MIWFTSDLHLGHINVIKYCNRPFADVKEHDTVLIQRWNRCVKPRDTIYVLGDLTLAKWDRAIQYLHQLSGRIRIVPGNHDLRGWLKGKDKVDLYKVFNGRVKLLPQIHKLRWEKKCLILCHYAMRSWESSARGSWQLYGHSHGTLSVQSRTLDVSVDGHSYYPISFDRVCDIMRALED